jgi:hypothetical protein
MRDDSSVRKPVEPTESPFSDTEAPTSLWRPTPLLPPPSSDLRDFGREPAKVSGSHPVQTPSSGRGVGPGELYPFPQDPSQAVDAVNEMLAKGRVRARASVCAPVPPLAAIAIDPPTRRGNVGSAFLSVLGKLLGFIGHVFERRPGQHTARAPSELANPHDDARSSRLQSGFRPVAKLPLVPPPPRVKRDMR